jgi:hypothetical protein
MGIQVVQHHTDHGRLREMHVHQVPHTGGEVLSCAPAGDLGMPPALQGLEEHKEVTGPLAPIFIGIPGRPTGADRSGLTHFTD